MSFVLLKIMIFSKNIVFILSENLVFVLIIYFANIDLILKYINVTYFKKYSFKYINSINRI